MQVNDRNFEKNLIINCIFISCSIPTCKVKTKTQGTPIFATREMHNCLSGNFPIQSFCVYGFKNALYCNVWNEQELHEHVQYFKYISNNDCKLLVLQNLDHSKKSG